MKRRTATLILGICLAVVAVAASPAYARSTTGFASFRVQNPNTSQNPYQCLLEDNGAVWNNCSYSVNLVFDLPIDNTGTHYITLQDYWHFPRTGSFTCDAYEYAGTGSGTLGTGVTFYGGGLTGYPQVTTPNGGESIQLICWNVLPGAGIANINWTQ
jgi:hypothetical protein